MSTNINQLPGESRSSYMLRLALNKDIIIESVDETVNQTCQIIHLEASAENVNLNSSIDIIVGSDCGQDTPPHSPRLNVETSCPTIDGVINLNSSIDIIVGSDCGQDTPPHSPRLNVETSCPTIDGVNNLNSSVDLFNESDNEDFQYFEVTPTILLDNVESCPIIQDINNFYSSLDVVDTSSRGYVYVSETESSDSDSSSTKRKRRRMPSKWEKNISKQRKNMGLEYVSRNTKIIKAPKKMGPPCTQKCKLLCSTSINEHDRQNIFQSFWGMGALDRQRDYILRSMEKVPSGKYSVKSPGSRRSSNYAYLFILNGERLRVCKKMFLNTLRISSKFIYTTVKKLDPQGILEPEMRGKHGRGGVKVPFDVKEDIRRHINSFPTVPSHYCRAHTNKKYLNGDLNNATMYRLYKEQCEGDNRPFAKQSLYVSIFNTEFNISFFQPKKDRCLLCDSFANMSSEERSEKQLEYDLHKRQKELSRKEKEMDIQRSVEDTSLQVACFDLQAVLPIPCGDVSSFFYKRRLNSFNFTIFNVSQKMGHCFTWHEGLGKRGANEIGSCILEYLKTYPSRNVIFYSDNCAGQNKNKFIASMFLYAVNAYEGIEAITHKFLVVGHTQNEGDSMHSLIEREKRRFLKSGPIYSPLQLPPIIRLAKKSGKPYSCKEMDFPDFFDLKKLQLLVGKNFSINTKGEKVTWNNISIFHFKKSFPHTIFYKTSYDDVDYMEIDVRHRMRGSNPSYADIQMKSAYDAPVPITVAKFDDLRQLCVSHSIPRQYWSFFEGLPVSQQASED